MAAEISKAQVDEIFPTVAKTIADALGCSVGTVKSQASRALAALRARAPESLDPRHSQEENR